MKDKTSISLRGYGVPFSRLTQQEVEKIKNELTVEPDTGFVSFTSSPQQSFKLYKESVSKLYIPKSYGLKRFGIPDEESLNPGNNIDVSFKGTLRPEQLEPINKFISACHNPLQRGGIINLSCGGGKTVLGLYAASILKKKTMIIVHKSFLLDQWKERIETFLPMARVGYVKAKTVDVKDKDIIIGSLQSLSMKEYEPNVFSDIGFVIVDEIHRTGTEVFSRALSKFNFMYSMGLTATLERKDGLTKVFMWSIGDIVYQNKSREDKVVIRCLPYIDTRSTRSTINNDETDNEEYGKVERMFNGKFNTSKMITQLCDFAPRTEFMAKIIIEEFDKSQRTRRFLVLSDRKKHLQDMYSALSRELTMSKNEADKIIGFYVGGMKESELKESETKTFILATFNFVSEGCDLALLDTLVLTSPKSSMEQIVGRILRKKQEDRINKPLVIDVYDDFSPFKNQFLKRKKYYKSMKYDIMQK